MFSSVANENCQKALNMDYLFRYLKLITILTCQNCCCGWSGHLFAVTDLVFQNFTNAKTIIVGDMNVCVFTCDAFHSCCGVNYSSKECILGFTYQNIVVHSCDSFIKKGDWKHAAKEQFYRNFVSIKYFLVLWQSPITLFFCC